MKLPMCEHVSWLDDKCTHPATVLVEAAYSTKLLCGIHARGWSAEVKSPVTERDKLFYRMALRNVTRVQVVS